MSTLSLYKAVWSLNMAVITSLSLELRMGQSWRKWSSSFTPQHPYSLKLTYTMAHSLGTNHSTGLNVHEPFPFVWTKPVFRS